MLVSSLFLVTSTTRSIITRVFKDKMYVCPVLQSLKSPVHGSHRGGRGVYAPENTMYAYRKAVHEHTTQILEIDLRLSKDGQIVLCHDEYVYISLAN